MSRRWLDPEPVSPSDALMAAVGDDPLLATLLLRRGLDDPDAAQRFLDAVQYVPAPAADLPDMQIAAERIERAIERGEGLLVWGDFDVDGQTSTALLVELLRNLGGDVRYYIPQRQGEGHGVYVPRLAALLDEHPATRLIITCDTGIAAHDAVDLARGRGVDVVITDHHQLPPTLPAAAAAVNPQRVPAGHPLRTLPGVGVAYKLAEMLYARAGRPAAAAPLLDLVALGIVADVALLTGDTRYLLQRGLDALRSTQRAGLRALAEVAGLTLERLDEGDIGFGLGPRLNALGRMGDANEAVELLTTGDESRALILARQLEGHNNERRMQTGLIYKAAVAQIEADAHLLDAAALVLAHETWTAGVVGIVANRLVEDFNRPVVLLVAAGDVAHGSARSVAGCDITAALVQVERERPGLLRSYGGHTMAAGMSLETARIPEFRRALGRAVADQLGAAAAKAPALRIDAYVSLADLTLDLAARLGRLAPFGAGNPPVTLATLNVQLKAARALGRSGEHQRLIVEDADGITAEALWWRADLDSLPEGRFDLACTLRVSEFQGNPEARVEVLAARATTVVGAVEIAPARRRIEALDYRHLDADEQQAALRDLPDDALVWNEGPAPDGVAGVRRADLRPAAVLVVWNAPPGPGEWRAALAAVGPRAVALFAVDAGWDDLETFVRRLTGAVKVALSEREGRADMQRLAGALGQRAATVRAGLDWLAARGIIGGWDEIDGVAHIGAGPGPGQPDALTGARERVEAHLRETSAYRDAFRRAAARSLLDEAD